MARTVTLSEDDLAAIEQAARSILSDAKLDVKPRVRMSLALQAVAIRAKESR